jgi:hypothetical protein
MAIEDALQRWQTEGAPGVPERVPFRRMTSDGVLEAGWVQEASSRYGIPARQQVVWRLFPDGTATWWEEGWNDGRTDLSVTRRFDAQALMTFRTYAVFSDHAWQGFPFEPEDRERGLSMILGWDVATVLSLYYSLWTFDAPSCGGCSKIKPVEGFTPRALYDPPRTGLASNTWEGLWQWGILQAIWRNRLDLRNLKDPATGNTVDGLVDPARFPQIPCNVSCSSLDPWINLGLSILTLGVGGIGSATISIVSMANQITRMRDIQAQAQAYRDFANSIGVGVSAINAGGGGQATVPSVITTPGTKAFPLALLALLLLL